MQGSSGCSTGIAPNSEIVDNLEGARAKMTVYQRWCERQAEDFPNRQQCIERTGQVLRNYDRIAGLLERERQAAEFQLMDLKKLQYTRKVLENVELAEASVDILQQVVDGLQGLRARVSELDGENRDLAPGAIAN